MRQLAGRGMVYGDAQLGKCAEAEERSSHSDWDDR
jgi:hypothetical protein